ncbi:MAG: hypothetical protein KIT33_01065 [Candidatus Kapabacteria bacterium]|nr:hypothetical protein [Ignavibacteriota bacterium]MCW5883538.1 hypothetical protein [Candidatus Kapabacteria bacterium]
MKFKLYILFLIFNCFSNNLLSNERTLVNISDTFEITFWLNTDSLVENNLKVVINFSNPTLVRILNAKIIYNNSEIEAELSKVNYYDYNLEVNIPPSDSIAIILNSEVLAGNDSIFDISLTNISINDSQYNPQSASYFVKTLNNELPYLRFTKITNVYPNPFSGNGLLNIEYYNDIIGEVEFHLFDYLSRTEKIKTVQNNTPGFQSVSLEINPYILSGLYYLEVRTKFRGNFVPIIIIK